MVPRRDCMSACAHVRSQASSLIGSVRLQGDPLACSKVDKHACLSPGRLAGLRNPKPTIDTRTLRKAVGAMDFSLEKTMLNTRFGRSIPSVSGRLCTGQILPSSWDSVEVRSGSREAHETDACTFHCT